MYTEMKIPEKKECARFDDDGHLGKKQQQQRNKLSVAISPSLFLLGWIKGFNHIQNSNVYGVSCKENANFIFHNMKKITIIYMI